MKTPQHIFALTKSEQRVVILILLALLAGAIAMHYREKQSHVSTPAADHASATGSTTPAAHEPAAPDD
jgi:hypothetical protein